MLKLSQLNGRLSHKGLVYGSTVLASRLMSSVFFFYFVKVYIDRNHMSQIWFQLSQFIYGIWNAVNDPLFGYMQNKKSWGWISVRRKCILYGALPWALSFLLPWFSWADYNSSDNALLCFLQVLFSLCLYDTFLTFVLLAHCSLMTEYCETDEERLVMVKCAGVAGILGSSSVFFADYFSNGMQDYVAFQTVCSVISIVSFALLVYTGLNANTKYDEKENGDEKPLEKSYWSLTKDIFQNKNFQAFIAVNFLQELHINYVMSFAKIFSEQMVPKTALTATQRSILLGSLVIVPQIAVVLVSPVIARFGLYNTQLGSFYSKVVLGMAMYLSDSGNTAWFIVFMICDFALADSCFSYFSINLSDIADEDQRTHGRHVLVIKRRVVFLIASKMIAIIWYFVTLIISHTMLHTYLRKPISSMIFGSNAFVVKPALSLGPMLVSGLLNFYGYNAIQLESHSKDDTLRVQKVIFRLACFAPVVIGSLQVLIWKKYHLRGATSQNPPSTDKESL